MRDIFLSTAGEFARSDFSGALGGGNGAIERVDPVGDARADDGVEPQLGHVPGVLGEGGVECADGESLPCVEALDSAREWDRTDGVGVLDACVKVRVKYLWLSSVQMEMIIFARIWPSLFGDLGDLDVLTLPSAMYWDDKATLTTASCTKARLLTLLEGWLLMIPVGVLLPSRCPSLRSTEG